MVRELWDALLPHEPLGPVFLKVLRHPGGAIPDPSRQFGLVEGAAVTRATSLILTSDAEWPEACLLRTEENRQ
jgi:hypothetical protein